MNTRVMTSGAGVISRREATSYAAWGTNRNVRVLEEDRKPVAVEILYASGSLLITPSSTIFFAVPAILALISSAFALPTLNTTIVPRACGTYISDDALIAAEAHFAANKVVSSSLVPLVATLTIYFHVIGIRALPDNGEEVIWPPDTF
ncbi:hypothetical protein C8R44DRAFT_866131 [Mycena epipterygia]|nr:hypothetical protein C8R44DRAFT_866131 [Mycena epipterygia]